MNAEISSSGAKSQRITVEVSTTVEPPDGERLKVRLTDFDSRSSLKIVEIGEDGGGDLCLIMTLLDGNSRTLRLNAGGLHVFGNGHRTVKF